MGPCMSRPHEEYDSEVKVPEPAAKVDKVEPAAPLVTKQVEAQIARVDIAKFAAERNNTVKSFGSELAGCKEAWSVANIDSQVVTTVWSTHGTEGVVVPRAMTLTCTWAAVGRGGLLKKADIPGMMRIVLLSGPKQVAEQVVKRTGDTVRTRINADHRLVAAAKPGDTLRVEWKGKLTVSQIKITFDEAECGCKKSVPMADLAAHLGSCSCAVPGACYLSCVPPAAVAATYKERTMATLPLADWPTLADDIAQGLCWSKPEWAAACSCFVPGPATLDSAEGVVKRLNGCGMYMLPLTPEAPQGFALVELAVWLELHGAGTELPRCAVVPVGWSEQLARNPQHLGAAAKAVLEAAGAKAEATLSKLAEGPARDIVHALFGPLPAGLKTLVEKAQQALKLLADCVVTGAVLERVGGLQAPDMEYWSEGGQVIEYPGAHPSVAIALKAAAEMPRAEVRIRGPIDEPMEQVIVTKSMAIVATGPVTLHCKGRNAFRVEDQGRLQLEGLTIMDGSGDCVWAGDAGMLRMSGCTLFRDPGDGSAVAKAAGWKNGVVVTDSAVAELDSLSVVDPSGDGVNCQGQARLWMADDCTLRGCGRFGLAVLNGSICDVRDTCIEWSQQDTLVCKNDSRVFVDGCSLRMAGRFAVPVFNNSVVEIRGTEIEEPKQDGLRCQDKSSLLVDCCVIRKPGKSGCATNGPAAVTHMMNTFVEEPKMYGVTAEGGAKLVASDCSVRGAGKHAIFCAGKAVAQTYMLSLVGCKAEVETKQTAKHETLQQRPQMPK